VSANLKRVGQQELMRWYNIDGHVVNQYAVLLSAGYDGAVLFSEKPHRGSQPADLPAFSTSDSFITCSNQNETLIPLAVA